MKQKILFTVCIAFIAAACKGPEDRAVATKTSEGQRSTAPSGASAADRDRALVRFVNAEPTLDKADLWFGDMQAFTGVDYKSVTPYKELPDDRKTFHLRAGGAPNDLATNNEGLNQGRHYMVVAMRKADNTPVLHAYSENVEAAPGQGKAKVRLINASPNAGDLELRLRNKNDELADDVGFGSASGFKEVDAGAQVVEVRHEDKKKGAPMIQNKTLENGKFYTIIALGDAKQQVLVIEDQLLPKTASR